MLKFKEDQSSSKSTEVKVFSENICFQYFTEIIFRIIRPIVRNSIPTA